MGKQLTKGSKILQYDPKTRAIAKELYISNYPPKKIQDALGINSNTLTNWIKVWYKEKEAHLDATMIMVKADKANVISQIHGLATSIVNENLKRIKKKQNSDDKFVMTTKDLKNIGDYMVGQDKISRLEAGTPTDILERQGLSPKEIMEVLKNDPFASVQEAEYEVLDDK